MNAIRNLGGLRPTASFAGHLLLGAFGFYRQYRRVDWSRVRRLVFVCSGNICRSPYGEELARMRGIASVSFGIHARGGAPADPAASRVAKGANVNLILHVSTRAADYEVRPGDLLLVMEPAQLVAARTLVAGQDVQVSLLGLWCRRPVPYLPDPYGHTDDCFRLVFSFVAEAVESIEGRLRQPLPLQRSITD